MTSTNNLSLFTVTVLVVVAVVIVVVVVGRVQLQIYASRGSGITFKVDVIHLSQSSDRLGAPGCRLGGRSHMESQTGDPLSTELQWRSNQSFRCLFEGQ